MHVTALRDLFPGAHTQTFLDSACVGLIPTTSRDAIIKFLDMALMCEARNVSEHHIAMDAMKTEAALAASQMIGCAPHELVLIESTTHGLTIAANSIPFTKTDEVIIPETEFLQVAIPFMQKQAKGELTVVPLKARENGGFEVEDFERLINKNTKAICLSAVQWCTGQRVWSKKLGQLCQSKNIWLIVDGIQEAGALHVDVKDRYCDFYIAGGHKWLNAPFGCGFMYMSPRAIMLEPQGYGYLNLSAPKEGWGSYFEDPRQTPFRTYSFPNVAQSFSIGGTGNYPGAIGLLESIKLVMKAGSKHIEERVLTLSGFLKNELRKIHSNVRAYDFEEANSGITMARLFADQTHERNLLHYLLEKRILLSIRYTNGFGGLRISTHYFNDEEDINRLCFAIKTLMEI